MLTIAEMAADGLGKSLAEDYRRLFGTSRQDAAERLDGIARIALECIGKSDALYHNLEHTLLVTQVGRDILRGRTLTERIEPEDYSHLIIACLLHDIGFVRGVLKGDRADSFVVGPDGERATLPRGSSDAALSQYHVDRSKLFVAERLGRSPTLDSARIARAIADTRFPVCPGYNDAPDFAEARLVQAADLIGQLGDAVYLKKANALFYEFEETGLNRQLGYGSPADLIDKYPVFFWNCVSMHIEEGVKLLNLTVSGRQWIANLHHHILCAERRSDLMMGPQLAADRGLKVAGRCELREMRKEVIVVGNLRLSRIAALP